MNLCRLRKGCGMTWKGRGGGRGEGGISERRCMSDSSDGKKSLI